MGDHHTAAKWWKEAIVYQVWPASFQDSNGDGYGDIRGIISRLDYLKQLGVTAVWVSPFFASPLVDNGYDISDYRSVDPRFGTGKDVDDLIAECKKRDMRVLLDLVINHTSDQHEWFKESRSSRDNPKADWYIWRDGKIVDGKRAPPNNWQAVFGGSVWEWDETRQQYYLHYFCIEQPDMNWELPEVRHALYADAATFWLKRGVSGFRIDTVNMYSKRLEFADAEVVNPNSLWQPAFEQFTNGPRLHEFLNEMNTKIFQPYDAVSIGELPHTPDFNDVLGFLSADREELDMALQFDLCMIDHDETPGPAWPWKLSDWKRITAGSQKLTDPEHRAWAVNFLENHDQGRSVPRFGNPSPEYWAASAKLLGIYLLTLSGTPIIYQGEEIGTVNYEESWPIEEYPDCATIGFWKKFTGQNPNDKNLLAKVRKDVTLTARDNARAPVQWTAEPATAGFTDGTPWVRTMASAKDINVASQENDKDSVLNFYRMLTALRKEHTAEFVYGAYKCLNPLDEQVMLYSKTGKDRTAVVALNFSSQRAKLALPSELEAKGSREVVSNMGTTEALAELQPWEGRIVFF